MAMIETWFEQDLKRPVKINRLDGNIFSQDNEGNLISVELFDNGEPAVVSGTVSGTVIRADGGTVGIDSGTLSGNKCSIILPQAAYAVPGLVSIFIKISSNGKTATICAVVAMCYRSSTDTAIDPGTIIPSIADLIAEIEAAIASVPADYSNLLAGVASNYSTSKTYKINALVWHDGELKKCIVPITTPESWTSAHWTNADIGTYTSNLRTAFDGIPTRNLVDDFPLESGTKYSISLKKRASGTYHLSGTKGTGSGLQEFVLFRDYSNFPYYMKKDTNYAVCVRAVNAFVIMTAYYNDTYTGSTAMYTSPRPLNGAENNALFRIPDNATGMAITIRIDDASSFDEDVYIYLIEQPSVCKRRALTNALILMDENSIDSIVNEIAGLSLTRTTVNGVKAQKTGDNTFYFNGTRTNPSAWSTVDLFRSHTEMPSGIEAGKTYCVYLNSKNVSFWVVSYDGDEDTTGTARYKSENNKNGDQYGTFTLPADGVQGVSLGFKLDYAESFNETVTLIIAEKKSEAEREFITSVNGITDTTADKKMYSIGNSFLTGIVYTNGSESGRCNFDDSIYGQIAMALGIIEDNVSHVYHGNTGFISPSTTSPFIYDSHSDVICDTDLSGYDYCLTHFNGSDLRKVLGNVNADGTGTTLADAVVRVVNHIISNKWICKLIILGTPPYSADYAGQNIFITPQGTSGNSINDMDNLMYALAKKYHFIYVSWQDLEISYHYMDFADYTPGDTGARHANSVKTYRALGEYAGTQLPAVSSPIAVEKLMG